jgi:hypothetical protein
MHPQERLTGDDVIARKESGIASTLGRVVPALLIVGALALAGCSASKQAVDPVKDRKAKMEAAAKFYVADAARDIASLKAIVYDPTNFMGLATATPPGAEDQTTAVSWAWQGSAIVMQAESDEATYTLSSTDASPSIVMLKDATGETLDTVFVKKVRGVWQVDAQAIQQAVEAQAKTPEGQQQTCWQNESDVEDAIASYDADKGKLPKTVANLVPEYLSTSPTCPTTGQGYKFDGTGLVLPCKVHGHYPESDL